MDGKGYDIVVNIRNDVPNNDFLKKSQLIYSIEFYENKNVATSVTIPANSKAHVNLDVATNNSIHENAEKINSSDERKSKKRAYDPKHSPEPTFKEVDGGVKIDFHVMDESSFDLESAAERARRESLDALLKTDNPFLRLLIQMRRYCAVW